MYRLFLLSFFISAALFGNECRNRLFLGPQAHYISVDAPSLGTFSGGAGGAEIGYEYIKPNGLFAHVELDGSWSSLSQSETTSSIDQVEVFFGVDIGYAFQWGDCYPMFEFIPYTGYFYHYLNEDRNIENYERMTFIYKMPYIPFGFRFTNWRYEWFAWGLQYQYQIDVDPFLKISILHGAYWELDRSDDQLIEGLIIFKPSCDVSIWFTPFYRYSKTGDSVARTQSGLFLGIQEQTYHSVGAKVEFSYLF